MQQYIDCASDDDYELIIKDDDDDSVSDLSGLGTNIVDDLSNLGLQTKNSNSASALSEILTCVEEKKNAELEALNLLEDTDRRKHINRERKIETYYYY